jgi:hypothetical protein
MRVPTLLAGALAALLLFSATGGERKSQTFTEILAARPAPKVEGLAERAKPELRGEVASESFRDILKLRDVGGSKAVPELAKVMENHIDSTRIHGFAAAQALFCIGTPEAHAVLKKYALSPNHRAGMAIDYTSHWEMDPAKSSAFIKRYCLQNLAKDLTLKLECKPGKDEHGARLDFTLTLRNVSDKSYHLRQHQVFQGSMMYFENADARALESVRGRTIAPRQTVDYYNMGRIITPRHTVSYYDSTPKWVELKPDATLEYKIEARVKRLTDPKQRPSFSFISPDAKIMLQTNDIAWGIGQEGRFKGYALVEAAPLNAAQKKRLGFDNAWVGRAVSAPLTVDVPPATK